jgi:hypothetical protein
MVEVALAPLHVKGGSPCEYPHSRRIRILDLDWRFDGCELLSRGLTESAAVCDSDSTNDAFSDDASYDIYDSAFKDSSTSYDSVENT